ncbi:MAG: helix-turn-helix transcriptional regulator [Oscillospiraceae bacterium]|nr:helix-turn-helix transcriptional regulator [Oscillospiraceae bacterium]
MEFNEKLQELRKNRGLTQEELAEILYVSRTAISKWESGRGYPNIESLKDISKFFSVSIDDLLSGERLISIAENENKSNIQNICDLLFGIVDIMSILLIILPLYPKRADDLIYSVNLFLYNESCYMIYWTMFISLVAAGIIEIIFNQMKIEKNCNVITNISIIVSIITVLFLIVTRQVYSPIIAFLFLILKGLLILKKNI